MQTYLSRMFDRKKTCKQGAELRHHSAPLCNMLICTPSFRFLPNHFKKIALTNECIKFFPKSKLNGFCRNITGLYFDIFFFLINLLHKSELKLFLRSQRISFLVYENSFKKYSINKNTSLSLTQHKLTKFWLRNLTSSMIKQPFGRCSFLSSWNDIPFTSFMTLIASIV